MVTKITDTNLEEFKKLVRKAIFLDSKEEVYFQSIDKEKWLEIFETNFNGNFNYAQRVMLNKFKDIELIDFPRVEAEKNKIFNLERATSFMVDSLNKQEPVIFITDFDNDGSLAQSIINQYLDVDVDAKNVFVEYAQTVNGNANRGFTVDLVDKIVEYRNIDVTKDFLIVTADNGINSVEEQRKIQEKYPLAKIVVTDHHNPEPEMVIEENEKVVIFNPHYNPTEFYKKFNISGATTVGVLLKNVLKKRYDAEYLNQYKRTFDTMNKLSKVANLLDYVNTDPVDKPEKDYIITKFLQLQPLLNINNSISKIITGGIAQETIDELQKINPNIDVNLFKEEEQNIMIQNYMAKIILKMYFENKNNELANKFDKDTIYTKLLEELNDPYNFQDTDDINKNYIEQLRPLIYSLSADDDKNIFMDTLNEKMIAIFEAVRTSEKKMITELRKADIVTRSKLKNSTIIYTTKPILKTFNRKFLNKVYNDENLGFALTLDNVGADKTSGSFRSLYDISKILHNRSEIEKELMIKIETPGHEKAAGFIIKNQNPNGPITDEVIEKLNKYIDKQIENIKKNEKKHSKTNSYLLTDLEAIKLIDRINVAIRGNVSNFARITPILKIDKNTVWTDSYSTKQYSMAEIVKERKYGYITINTDFDGGTVIVPVELVRRLVDEKFTAYLSLNYMDGGVFMAEKVLKASEVAKVTDLRNKNEKAAEIEKVFSTDFKDKIDIKLTRDQIKDNPFFKYHDYGNLHFDLFEKMIIGVIDSNELDTLAVFDVEANGFGNSKLMNLGSMNYSINKNSGEVIDLNEFQKRYFHNERGEEFILNDSEVSSLREITLKDKEKLPLIVKKQVLIKSMNGMDSLKYYLPPVKAKNENKKNHGRVSFTPLKNWIVNKDGSVNINREIEATMLATLVYDNDFKVPQEMTNLTGITQEHLEKYGRRSAEVDTLFADFYKGKKVLFGAHNTPYDTRVLRANTPKFYNFISNSRLYDSANFSKDEKLAYDDVKVASFSKKKIVGLSDKIYFYNNEFSDFNIKNFLETNENGYYPDRSGNYLLEIEDNAYYLVDKVKHEKIKIEASQEDLLFSLSNGPLPNISIKYSVERLSEQWMIRSLLLSDEKFNISLVNLDDNEFNILKKHEEALNFFQSNYHFDSSAESNLCNFLYFYGKGFSKEEEESLKVFVDKFLKINKDITQKFSDAWMYKKVLHIKDPKKSEVTNDLIELINFQTNIPKEKIRIIFDEAIKFKEKYKIDHILQHEGHVNGPWETDAKGDIAFEDKLTFSLLSQRMYDSYNHSIDLALRKFNEYMLRAELAFRNAEFLSDDLAQDSYSFRQGILYDREDKTTLVKGIQEKEEKRLSKEESIIRFKLQNDVVPQDTGVYAIATESSEITREQLEKDSDMLSFIMVNEQIKSTLKSYLDDEDEKGNKRVKKVPLTPEQIEQLSNILNQNNEKSLNYKKDLSNRYRYVEFNRKDDQYKKLIKSLLEDVIPSKQKTKTSSPKVSDLTKKETSQAIKVVEKYIEDSIASKNLDENQIDYIALQQYKLAIDEYSVETSLNSAFNNKDSGGLMNAMIKEENFLQQVEIKRENPIKFILEKHSDLRLEHGLILKHINAMNKKNNLKI